MPACHGGDQWWLRWGADPTRQRTHPPSLTWWSASSWSPQPSPQLSPPPCSQPAPSQNPRTLPAAPQPRGEQQQARADSALLTSRGKLSMKKALHMVLISLSTTRVTASGCLSRSEVRERRQRERPGEGEGLGYRADTGPCCHEHAPPRRRAR